MFTTYAETLEYLYAALPMYQRIGAAAFKKDLTNTLALVAAADNPHEKYRTVHVAGTNGKGSSSHLLASALQAAGYRTGLYTSPHYHDFRERIRVSEGGFATMIPETDVVAYVNEYRSLFERIEPSFFEMTVAMAFWYFARVGVEVAVVEVGLGGRLDSTNIITPAVSLITNISLDHQAMLGNTLPEIATEKAGIIKNSVPVVVSETQNAVREVFISTAATRHAPLVFADAHFTLRPAANAATHTHLYDVYHTDHPDTPYLAALALPLAGNYQTKNAVGVLATFHELRQTGFSITDEAIRKGFAEVVERTGLVGRWQTLGSSPTIIADSGHNVGGLGETMQQLDALLQSGNYTALHFVLGTVNDKDLTAMLQLLPRRATYYFTRANIPRALAPTALQSLAKQAGLEGAVYESVATAFAAARAAAVPTDLVFVGGSVFVVGEAIEAM